MFAPGWIDPLEEKEKEEQKYKILLIVFKGMNDLAPEYITQLLQPHNPHKLRSTDKSLHSEPRSNRS